MLHVLYNLFTIMVGALLVRKPLSFQNQGLSHRKLLSRNILHCYSMHRASAYPEEFKASRSGSVESLERKLCLMSRFQNESESRSRPAGQKSSWRAEAQAGGIPGTPQEFVVCKCPGSLLLLGHHDSIAKLFPWRPPKRKTYNFPKLLNQKTCTANTSIPEGWWKLVSSEITKQ